MTRKLESFAVSFIESIAQKRGRNVEWAASTVRDSVSATAEQALQAGAIDLIAEDLPELLRRVDGREMHGRPLATAAAEVVEIPMLGRERVFQMLWRPEVMFILMLVAIYGIIGELSNPGAIVPGVLGVVALILSLYLGSVLPINVAGVALLVLAVVLFIIDAFAPTHGALTVGGLIAFFLGALMLFDSPVPALRLSLAFVVPATLLTAAFFMFVVGAGLRAQYLPVRAGREALIGQTAEAITTIDAQSGRARVEGEDWSAVSDEPVASGQNVEIIRVNGLSLVVRPTQKAKETS